MKASGEIGAAVMKAPAAIGPKLVMPGQESRTRNNMAPA
jgi:hypothetical protein